MPIASRQRIASWMRWRALGWSKKTNSSKAPQDSFFARGFMGQFVVVVPSQRLVIVRLSVSHVRGDDIEATNDLVGDVLAAWPAR